MTGPPGVWYLDRRRVEGNVPAGVTRLIGVCDDDGTR